MDIQFQDDQKAPIKIKPKKPTLKYIVLKLSKVTESENLKNNKRKARAPIR